MKLETNRIFISDLPETASKDELQNIFGNYGEVSSIEIKERKELGQKNTSLFFAYVTINIDAKSLNNCFNDFSKGKWFGQRVMLQIARESFLDRLKRERQSQPSNIPKVETTSEEKPSLPEKKINGISKYTPKKHVSSDSDSSSTSSSESEDEEEKPKLVNKNQKSVDIVKESQYHDPDFKIKNNRGKVLNANSLKIESVGKEPIIKIEKQNKKTPINTSDANIKRLKSLKNLKQGYQNQKSLIQAALSNVDSKPKNKIIFDDAEDISNNKTTSYSNKHQNKIAEDKKSLFNGSESEEEFEPSFSVKEHFQGTEGQKLLELQSKYKNDKRFTLDARFLNDDKIEQQNLENSINETEDISLEEEKRQEYAILEKVLGKKVLSRKEKQVPSTKKSMLRFDPSQPEHSKYEIPKSIMDKKEKKRKRKDSETEMIEEKKVEEKEAPEVSKEVFFKISDDLKETFEEKKEFSLLSMFGRHEDKDEEIDDIPQEQPVSVNNKFQQEKNPFKYDSSDDEDQTEDIPSQKAVTETETKQFDNIRAQAGLRRTTTWTDSFFFKVDDYRLQEGLDFVEK
ncbi:probable RNA-binding protein CG14230 [Diabrotica undecimpunctata]|uniref:probable RNA-binding protein CG14230 n=1 Tax=Diabrotica undecimpunctata TaxID=50387 RepID=UPI003B63D53F